MATYRIKEDARTADGSPISPIHYGVEFEWDGVSVDEDGDISVRSNGSWVTYVGPASVELAGSEKRAKASTRTRTIEEKVITLTLTEEEALLIRDVIGATYGNLRLLEVIYDDLGDALGDGALPAWEVSGAIEVTEGSAL